MTDEPTFWGLTATHSVHVIQTMIEQWGSFWVVDTPLPQPQKSNNIHAPSTFMLVLTKVGHTSFSCIIDWVTQSLLLYTWAVSSSLPLCFFLFQERHQFIWSAKCKKMVKPEFSEILARRCQVQHCRGGGVSDRNWKQPSHSHEQRTVN